MRSKRQREEEVSETDESCGEDFIDDDDASDWRQELKAITGYDPSK